MGVEAQKVTQESRFGNRSESPHPSTRARLQEYLFVERSAVATYDLALSLGAARDVAWSLLYLRIVHDAQARSILRHLGAHGGAPSSARPVPAAADVLWNRTLLAGVDELEDRVLAVYQEDTAGLDERALRLVDSQLEPAQKRTRDWVASLVSREALRNSAASAEIMA